MTLERIYYNIICKYFYFSINKDMYKSISNFGKSIVNTPSDSPLTYCLSQTDSSGFMNGGIGKTIGGKHGKNCQAFMSSYCANKWDDICEVSSKDRTRIYPNTQQLTCSNDQVLCQNMNAGQVLIANTAARKYLSNMLGSCSCNVIWQPFDPTVASSPLISMWEGNQGCIPVYEVNPKEIDNDPVMNKILDNPKIAWSILVNIYNTAVRKRTLNDLKRTKIYKLFMSQPFQNYIKNMKV